VLTKVFLNPSTLPSWSGSFSQVVVVEGAVGRTVYVSGQVAVDAASQVVGVGDLAAQADRAFRNLVLALDVAGARVEDVVRLGIYVKGDLPANVGVIREALRRVFRHDDLPAATWLGVASLALEELLIEVEAVAVVAG
jgi:enamine deaminase RidA (YjgF/YER057c/UK114 family)